jgi:hypothetical protein
MGDVELGLDTLNIFSFFSLGRKSRQNEKRKNALLFRERERERERERRKRF